MGGAHLYGFTDAHFAKADAAAARQTADDDAAQGRGVVTPPAP